MPVTESAHSEDRDRDRDQERGDRNDRAASRQKSSTSTPSKSSKDLSHVPCKFFKVGACTAGSSCPFSHAIIEPGGQKETCAWFVKGNCKFGHKCALAHILPGQSMAMDRKNKKAAQAAAGAGADRLEKPERGPKDGKSGRGGGAKREGQPTAAGSSGTLNTLLSGGSTAPTRITTSTPTGRPPISMPLKATLSPSAPAPPLASFGVLDDLEGAGVQLPTAPAQGKQPSQDSTTTAADASTFHKERESEPKAKSPEPLPTSAPRPAATPKQRPQYLGPIGSPPSSGPRPSANGALSHGTPPRAINGINVASPATENGSTFMSSSPFSAPGSQSAFNSGSLYSGGGLAASLGSGLAMMGGRRGWRGGVGEDESVGAGGASGLTASAQRINDNRFEHEEFVSRRSHSGGSKLAIRRGVDVAVVDEDLEDFLPSSLTDLLTPEERSRRMSRSNSGQPQAGAFPASGKAGFVAGGFEKGSGVGNGGMGSGHRYSYSVPAPSLLGDIKSIWGGNNIGLPSSPPAHKTAPSSSLLHPTHPVNGDDTLSMSIGSAGSGIMGLSPSNASAAFLPGLHQHYMTSKVQQAQQFIPGGLGASIHTNSGQLLGRNGQLFSGSSSNAGPSNHIHTHINAATNAQHMYRASPSPFDLTQPQHQHLHQRPLTARPIPSNAINSGTTNQDDGPHILSPGSRALQSHAPGQSLPQGLAAGLSRIHALPPPPSLASPSSANAFGSGTPPADTALSSGLPSSGPYGGWRPSAAGSPPANSAGLESMFSRLSYSAAAASASRSSGLPATQPGPSTTGSGALNTVTPPGLTRNVSGSRYPQQATGPLSPLSGPVVSKDDDDELFSMDG